MAVVGDLAGNPITLQNAAEESTLQRAVAALNVIAQKSAGGGIDSRSLSIFQQNLRNASGLLHAAGNELGGVGTAANMASGALNRAGSVFSSAGSVMSQMLASSQKATASLSGGFAAAKSRLDTAIKQSAVPETAKKAVMAFTNTLALGGTVYLAQIESYQRAAQAGADLGGSLTKAHLTAVQAGLNLSQFTDALRQSPEAFALFAGGTQQGAANFARMNRVIQGNLLGPLSRLGVNATELTARTAEATQSLLRAGYTADQLAANQGRVQQIVVQDIAIQRQRAKLNGTTLEQERQKMKATQGNLDVELAAQTAGLNDKQRQALERSFESLQRFGPSAQQLMLQMVAMGTPMNEATAVLQTMQPELARAISEASSEIKNTTNPNALAFSNFQKRLNADAVARDRAANAPLAFVLRSTGTQGAATNALSESFMGLNTSLIQLRSGAIKALETDMQELGKEADKATQGMARLAVATQGIITTLASSAAEMTKDGVPDVVSGVAKILDDAASPFADAVATFVDGVASFVSGIFGRDVGTYGATGQITEPKDIVTKIHKGEIVYTPNQIANLENTVRGLSSSAAANFQSVQSPMPTLGSQLPQMTEAIKHLRDQLLGEKEMYGTAVSEDTAILQGMQPLTTSPSVMSLKPEIEEAIKQIAMGTLQNVDATTRSGEAMTDLLTDIKMISR